MKFHRNKLLTAVSAVALVLAVGACSSNGDDGVSAERDTALEDLKAANAKLADATAEVMRLEGLIGDETDPAADSLRGMLAAEQAEVVRLKGLIGDDADPADDSLRDQLAAAKAQIDNDDPDNLGLMQQLAAAEAALSMIERDRESDLADDIAEAASDKAAEVLKALEMLSGTAPGVMVSASSAGGDITAKAANYVMSSTTPDAINGFRGAILTKDGAELHVYSDIENAVATPIDGIYGSSALAGEPARYSLVAEGSVTTLGQEIPWSKVTRDDSKTGVDRSGTTPVSTFAGSVRGLAGVFSCTATGPDACGAPPRGTNGAVAGTFGTLGWTFAPTDPNGTIEIADGDPESKDGGYLQFGWWLNMMGDDVGDGFDVDTFASATGMDQSPELQSGVDGVEGSATYTGGAAGKWAIASTTEDSTEGGHFTATATLGVDFDADLEATDDMNDKAGVSVSGSITDFMTGETSRPSWKVTLTVDNPDVMGAQTAGSLPQMFPVGHATTKWTTGGAVDGTGTWEAMFHGSEKDTMHPTAVVGTFNAAIADGAVGQIQGAFGATK